MRRFAAILVLLAGSLCATATNYYAVVGGAATNGTAGGVFGSYVYDSAVRMCAAASGGGDLWRDGSNARVVLP